MPCTDTAHCCRYRLDAQDRLSEVDDGWTGFAQTNQGEAALPDVVIGQPIWRFIAGKDNRMVYSRLFTALRTERRNASFPFRCDAPALRRDLQMHIRPQNDGALDFQTEIVDEQPRDPIGLLDPRIPHTSYDQGLILICSWCMNVETELGRWHPLDVAWTHLSDPPPPAYPGLKHTLCPACKARMNLVIRG